MADTLNIASKEWTWIKPLYPNMSQLSLLGNIHSEVSIEGTLSDFITKLTNMSLSTWDHTPAHKTKKLPNLNFV